MARDAGYGSISLGVSFIVVGEPPVTAPMIFVLVRVVVYGSLQYLFHSFLVMNSVVGNTQVIDSHNL